MTTREQVRADTALIERLTAELAAERAEREAADNCYDDLRREVERLRLTCSEQDRILSLARARAEAAEARVRALEAAASDLVYAWRPYADTLTQSIFGADGTLTPEVTGNRRERFWRAFWALFSLLSGSGETAVCKTCHGANEITVNRIVGRRAQSCVEPCPKCAQSTDEREG